MPAFLPDGRWWNGREWVNPLARRTQRPMIPGWLWLWMGLWFVAMVVPWFVVAHHVNGKGQLLAQDVFIILAVNGLATVATGIAVGITHVGRYAKGVVVAVGSVASLIGLFIWNSAPSNGQADGGPGASIGVLVLAIPTVLAVASILGMGFCIGIVLRRLIRPRGSDAAQLGAG